tara:strand:+ start:41 stop:298 length:258 start_codon:yes stop_codon:yes gene_type:complete
MAKDRLPYNELGRTAKFYRDKPDADEKHKKTSIKAAKKPARKRKNAETRKYRRDNGLEGDGGRTEVHHGRNGLMTISRQKNASIK